MEKFENIKLQFPEGYIEKYSFNFKDNITQQKLKLEENCIREIIKKYTGNILTIKEAKKIQRIFYMNDYSKYILSYDGVKLGMIRYINSGCNFTVEFTPNEINF